MGWPVAPSWMRPSTAAPCACWSQDWKPALAEAADWSDTTPAARANPPTSVLRHRGATAVASLRLGRRLNCGLDWTLNPVRAPGPQYRRSPLPRRLAFQPPSVNGSGGAVKGRMVMAELGPFDTRSRAVVSFPP